MSASINCEGCRSLAAELEATKRELDEAREEVILANFDGHYARAEAAEAALAVAQDALREARGYVVEPGEPGTEIVTTEESSRKSKELLIEIDAALAVPADTKEPT